MDNLYGKELDVAVFLPHDRPDATVPHLSSVSRLKERCTCICL